MSALDEIRQREQAATKGPWGVGASFGTIYGFVEGSAPTLLFEPHPNHIIPATGRPSEDCLADGEFIAFARGDVPRLLAAVDAALAVHQPVDALMYGSKNAHPVQVCTGCGQDDGNWNRYPCPTVRAINNALEVGK